ncbi:MAG TPA: M43 family zinc metalloprotease, partial [bacterium]|nr:M43 family zinc metalloprotease [bacterium]
AFRALGLRCATPDLDPTFWEDAPGDCTLGSTTINSIYEPFNGLIQIPVVVHIIMNTTGSGVISDALVQSQIDILNEDYLALTGTNGENGTYGAIQFELATEDPLGNPTTGIMRYNNTTWYNDSGSYWLSIEWDPTRYINVYTNSAGGALGYVPAIPQAGVAGNSGDRIVVLYSAFGRNAPIGAPYDQGRTLTHEMGHYLGLLHTFSSGCQPVANCYNNGDLICDTNAEQSPVFGCPGSISSCSTPNPYHNYMDYSDDLCMEEFTPEQVNRMRCTLENWRPDLPLSAGPVGVETVAAARSAGMLRQNVPNPFSPVTTIAFDLPVAGNATLRVLDVAGRTVRTLADGTYSAGRHDVTWNGTDDAAGSVAAGVYFYRLETSAGTETRRMVKMK